MSPVLGIETSCDDTSFAFVKDGRVLAEKSASQEGVHSLFGGVVPEIASREHLRLLSPLLKSLLDESGLALQDAQAVAVARGPGLLGSLLMGLCFAKSLALALQIPLIGVNHLHAHILAVGIENRPEYPFLGLLASGGHSHIYLVNSPTEFVLLGKTLDDAAGEAFDKAAKAMNLPYPGGIYIDLLGQEGKPDKSLLPRAYLDNDNLDFSFSGLKTAISQHIRQNPELRPKVAPLEQKDREIVCKELSALPGLNDLCASINFRIAQALCVKLERALQRNPAVRGIAAAGGVAANSRLRSDLKGLAEKYSLPLYLPSNRYCADNGAMIAFSGEILHNMGFYHGLELEAIPRGRIVPQDYLRGT